MDTEEYLMASKYFSKASLIFPSNKDAFCLNVISIVRSYTYSFSEKFIDDVVKYDITTDTFTTVATYAGSSSHIAEFYAGYIYMFGGGLQDLIKFDTSTHSFQTVSYSGVFDNRNIGAAADMYLNKIYIIANRLTYPIET
jgi:hypothetical protein